MQWSGNVVQLTLRTLCACWKKKKLDAMREALSSPRYRGGKALVFTKVQNSNASKPTTSSCTKNFSEEIYYVA